MANKGAGKFRLEWRGPLLDKELEAVAREALTEIGLRIEAEAKKELYPGHGKVTGTLQRSIHVAPLGYEWGNDNVTPGEGSREMGGQEVVPSREGKAVWLEIGSGLEYAMAIHQADHTFSGYDSITKGLEAVVPKVPQILKAAARKYARA